MQAELGALTFLRSMSCHFSTPDTSHLRWLMFASVEANCPSTRASEHALRSVGEKSRFTVSSSKTNQASAVERMSTSLTLDNKTTESSHSKCSNIAKLLISIGDQFKTDSENVATDMDTLQIGEDLEELSLMTSKNNAQEVFCDGIEGVLALQTSVTQWLDKVHDLPVGWKNA